MVLTRASRMDSQKSKTRGVKSTGNEKSKADNQFANNSNVESEDEQSTHASMSGSSGLKVRLKKTRRSCSSSSSRESTQSFEVVRNVPSANVSASSDEDSEDQRDSESEKTSNNPSLKNEVESKESKNDDTSADEDSNIEVLSDDSEESFTAVPSPTVENEKNVNLKTEDISLNPAVVKKEEDNIKVKLLKEEKKEPDYLLNEIVVLKDDDDDDDDDGIKNDNIKSDNNVKSDNNTKSDKISIPQNGVQKKESNEQNVKELKFKVNVRSFDDLAAPCSPNLINNMPPPGQLDGPPNYLPQNDISYAPPPYINLSCDVCRMHFDSSELLNQHKVAMKHFKCSFKECEHLVISSQQEFLDHQRLVHNIMPSPVQQLTHQVQRIPAMGFDQQLQSGVPPLPESLSPLPPSPQTMVPNIYTQTLRMPNQQLPMRSMLRPMVRQPMPLMMPGRGRNITRTPRGRSVSMNSNMMRGNAMKRPGPMPMRQTPPKRATMDRNPYLNNRTSPQIAKSLSESLTKSLTSANKPSASPTTQDVVNLFSKRGLTISTVETVNNINLPAGISLNSAVSIIPTKPNKNLDTVDLTGSDPNPREKKFWPCDVCSKTYTSVETLCEHIAISHKSVALQYKCNLCSGSFPNADMLSRHKQTIHRTEINNNPFVIPIIDLKKAGMAAKLHSLGITSYVPVAQLDNQGGQFGLPIMSTSRPGSIDGLRYSNFFNLGCIRKI